MPRPKGTFKKPEDIAKLTPEQREKYFQNTLDYKRNFKRREDGKRRIPNYVERRQRDADAQLIAWDAFPESILREWLRTNATSVGECRHRAARWGMTNAKLSKFLQGTDMIHVSSLHQMQLDTGIFIEKLLVDYDTIKASYGL